MLTYFGDWPGYNEISFTERYRLIRQAGFGGTLVWWDEEEQGDFRTQQEYARKAGLWVENMHASFDHANDFWQDDVAGQAVFDYYMMCVNDCGAFEIPTVVMHTGCGGEPLPPISEISLRRFAQLIERAEQKGVNIAIENQCDPVKTQRAMDVLERFDSPRLGMCFDSGHANVCALGAEMLKQYGHRLKALHLHDNHSANDEHLLPFEGNIDWPELMRKIELLGYQGATTLEVGGDCGAIAPEEYLARAYEQAKKLDNLRRTTVCVN